jgi:hypothetical protein
MYHRDGNLLRHTRSYFFVTLVKWKLVLVHLETVSILTQDKCMVCANVP